MMEDMRRLWRGSLETLTVTENWSEGRSPSIVDIVCFMESLAESETPLDMREVSRGSICLSMVATTENSLWKKPAFLVETKSSETPPPSTPETRQLTTPEKRGFSQAAGERTRGRGDG